MQTASYVTFPQQKYSVKRNKKYKTNWITSGILKSMDRRDQLFDKWMVTKDAGDRTKYNLYRNKVNRIVIAAKKLRNGKDIELSQSNNKKFWKCLNKIAKGHSNSTGSTLPEELKVDGVAIKDPKHIANQLNTHFVLQRDLD